MTLFFFVSTVNFAFPKFEIYDTCQHVCFFFSFFDCAYVFLFVSWLNDVVKEENNIDFGVLYHEYLD